MELFQQFEHCDLDKEWVLLIRAAKEMGLSAEEIRIYIANSLALQQRQLKHVST